VFAVSDGIAFFSPEKSVRLPQYSISTDPIFFNAEKKFKFVSLQFEAAPEYVAPQNFSVPVMVVSAFRLTLDAFKKYSQSIDVAFVRRGALNEVNLARAKVSDPIVSKSGNDKDVSDPLFCSKLDIVLHMADCCSCQRGIIG
jgi:hypothetical protein